MADTFTIDEALAYARKHELHALVAARGTTVLAEVYGDGYDGTTPHALYSGTKSFWGLTALAAQRDGIVDLDASVAADIPSWKGDAAKAKITPRMLLSLTAGYGFGGLGSAVPPYDRAIEIPLKTAPGTTFTYGGQLQQTVLVINTVLLLGVLIVIELVYSETPRTQRQHLKYFYPLLLVLIGLLIFAAYKQTGNA